MKTPGPSRRHPSAFSTRALLFGALASLALVACGGKASGPAPVLGATSPEDGTTAASVNARPTATFDVPMSSLTSQSFTVTQGTTAVPGSVTMSEDNRTAIFTPTSPLTAGTLYTASVTTAATSADGAALTTARSWSFTTSAEAQDSTPPEVASTSPAQDGTEAGLNTKIAATFSKAMDPLFLSASSVSVKVGTTAVPGTVALALGNTVTFTPTSAFAASTTVTVTLSTDLRDVNGNQLASAFTWSFTTGAAPDTTPPEVTVTSPVDASTGVATNTRIAASFGEPMDPLTFTTSSFTVLAGTTPVAGTVAYAGSTATFKPSSALPSSTQITATVTPSAKDLSGNALASAFSWTFTTGSAAALGPAVVQLGTAANYVVLAKTGISTVPSSAITGNIAVSPAAATYITGFSLVADATNVFATSPQITGRAYAANYAAPTPSNLTTAVGNMQTAYTDAAGRPSPNFLEFHTGNIGGQTLAPGLYKWTSAITVPADVTISGGANDVWIFQTSGDLNISANQHITLAGGAQAKNIFWQVAGQTTFGAGSHFEGILLCKTQVNLLTGASMNGRILSQTQVALQQATVVQPAQ